MFLLAVLALLAPTGLYATRLDVCNKGQVPVTYATAERQGSFLFGYKWVVAGWYLISPGHCDDVYHERGDGGGHIHVAFAFTDSTGTWGAADFEITHDSGVVLRHSDRRFCVTMNPFNYTRAGDDLGGACEAGFFSFPAALYLEPGAPIGCGTIYGFCGNYDFDFALTTKDRAIPVGPKTSTGGASPGPGTTDEFVSLLKGTMDTLPDSEQTQGPDGKIQLKPGYRWVHPCAEPSVIRKESLSNLQTTRAKALTDAIRKFILAHNKGDIRFRVTEPREAVFGVEQTGGKTGDCRAAGDYEFLFQSPDGGASLARPAR